jgi:hypothetical protein
MVWCAAPTHSSLEVEQHETALKPKSQTPKLYVDRLLENRDTHGIGELRFEACLIKVNKAMSASPEDIH